MGDPVVVALDAGTTGVRAIAFAPDSSTVASSYREFTQHFPRPGWVEHDPDEIWEAVQVVLGEVAEALTHRGAEIAAIGITDQRETTVVWDRASGRPLHRALVWQDRRTAARCDELERAGHLPAVRATTGLVLDPYFSGSKLEWLFGPGGIEPTEEVAAGTIDSWLLFKLTGGRVHATDVSNASRTMLLDLHTRNWSPTMCELFGVPDHVLPRVVPSSGRIATTDAASAVGPGVPISGMAGDQQAALFGHACFDPGMTKNTYGTGSFVLMNVGDHCPEPVEGLLTTIAWTVRDGAGIETTSYALEGAIFATGATVQWLRDGLGIIDEAAEVGPLAESVPDTGDVYLVPAFTGLGSPWWDPYARGTIVGITRGTGRAQLARAVVEAMAFQTRDVVEAMATSAGRSIDGLRVDGGAAAMDLLLGLQADQLGVPVSRAAIRETTALGAAYLAGLAEGVWASLDAIGSGWAYDAHVDPSDDRTAADFAHRRWTDAVARSRGWASPS